LIIPIIVVLFNVFLLIFPQIVLAAAREGLLLWFNNVLPTLLPFMIATNMLISLGFADFLAGLLAPVMRKIFGLPGAAGFGLVAGLTSGYPIGAKTVADLRRNGQLSSKQAQHLVSFCNNAGPLFILGVVGVGMFGDVRVGYVLWAAHIFGALLVGIILRGKSEEPHEKFSFRAVLREYREKRRSNVHSIGKVFGDAVANSMEAMTFIGGIIIFFSVVLAGFQALGLPQGTIFDGMFAGLIEVTGGARRLSALEPTVATLACTAFVVAFGGFSVHAQSFHFTAGTGIKNGAYLFAKFLHGIFAAGFTAVFHFLRICFTI
jgi:sporulation integral membrane protein YlbJ